MTDVLAIDSLGDPEILAFLRSLAAGDDHLRAEAITPAAFGGLQPAIFFMERGDGDYIYQRVGPAIESHVGRRMTAARLSEIRNGRLRDELFALFEDVWVIGRPGVMVSRLSTESRPDCAYRRFVAPLFDDADCVSRLVGFWRASPPQTGGVTETASRILFHWPFLRTLTDAPGVASTA